MTRILRIGNANLSVSYELYIVGQFLSPYDQLNLVVDEEGPDSEEEYFRDYKPPSL